MQLTLKELRIIDLFIARVLADNFQRLVTVVHDTDAGHVKQPDSVSLRQLDADFSSQLRLIQHSAALIVIIVMLRYAVSTDYQPNTQQQAAIQLQLTSHLNQSCNKCDSIIQLTTVRLSSAEVDIAGVLQVPMQSAMTITILKAHR